MTDRRQHWERAHASKAPEEQSWFQPRPEMSLALIRRTGFGPLARIIDVGGGSSRLVDALVDEGYRNVTVLDIAAPALAAAKARLDTHAALVRWIVADVTSAAIEESFDIWHDRAVFHFLIEAEDRAAYVRNMKRSLSVGGFVILATFAEGGPTRCSGLPVVRYGSGALAAELGEGFELVVEKAELHRTPAGRDQSFVYCLFRRAS